MALIKCRQCGKEVSDISEKCIQCGCKIEKALDVQNSQQDQQKVPISICPECKMQITKKVDNCSNCGCPLDFSNLMICKINGVDYNLRYFYQQIVEKEQTLEQAGEILRGLRDFLDLFEYPKLYDEIVETKKIPQEFNGQSLKRVWEQRRQEEEAKPKIYCKYCGSDNVRKLGPFEKLAVQCIGKEWHCKKCNSDF